VAYAAGNTPSPTSLWSNLSLFPMPTVDDIAAHYSIRTWCGCSAGSVAGLLAMWRLHGVDTALHYSWQAGVVLTGISEDQRRPLASVR
jgi:hypothetical protein